jgi:DNA-binding XRE family transcriptional regulator
MKIFAKGTLKLNRIMSGFTIVQLAEKVDMSAQALGQVERLKNGISPENAKKVCEVLEKEFDEVFMFVKRKNEALEREYENPSRVGNWRTVFDFSPLFEGGEEQ